MTSENTPPLTDMNEYLKNLEKTKEYSFHFYEFMESHIDKCLSTADYDSLFELLPYFENPKKYPLLTYSADVRRMYHILQIMDWEKRYQKTFYATSAANFSELKTQYVNTVFSLRRLEMNLPDALLSEAIHYLLTIPFDIYAAELFISGEFFDNYDRIYSKLLSYFAEVWSLQNRITFCYLWEKKSHSDLVYLTLSSLFIEKNDLLTAYNVLMNIKNPSTETKMLIHQLKDVLLYEPK